jgi:cardiolipin synthase
MVAGPGPRGGAAVDWLGTINFYWHEITAWVAVLDVVLVLVVVPWVLSIKKEPTSALAWTMLVIFVPLFGAFLFVLFGYQSVHRPLARKRRHRRTFRATNPVGSRAADAEAESAEPPDRTWEGMGRLANQLDAYPLTSGNRVTFYHDGPSAFAAMFDAVRAARHHVHAQFYIFECDEIGREFLDLLTAKAREGVEVRLLYDAVGSHRLSRFRLRRLHRAGGWSAAFLPLNLLRRRIQVNLRNHRKILVVDGKVAFTGGMNIGDEYVDRGPLNPWRDTQIKIDGPSAESLQRIFIEDWDFASGESLKAAAYFQAGPHPGGADLQVIQSGPDQEVKSIRETYFAAAFKARRRLWITTPYYVPDQGLRDALCMGGRTGIDVRLLLPRHADHWFVHYATRYYLPDLLDAGVKVYLYTQGFIHAKIVLADGQWASVGTANLDNRSLLLNFEVNCLIYTPAVVAELERTFLNDLDHAIRLDPKTYARRRRLARIAENVCRLMSPIL